MSRVGVFSTAILAAGVLALAATATANPGGRGHGLGHGGPFMFLVPPGNGMASGMHGPFVVRTRQNFVFRSVREVRPTSPQFTFREAPIQAHGCLPPGLQMLLDRDGSLPPGLERQLNNNGTLPPGLAKRQC